MDDWLWTHWGRVMHICVSDLNIIGSDNVLSPGRRQAIIWTNAGILLIRPLGTNFREILIEILIFSFRKMHLKVSSAKRRPFCLGLNVLTEASFRQIYLKSEFLCEKCQPKAQQKNIVSLEHCQGYTISLTATSEICGIISQYDLQNF